MMNQFEIRVKHRSPAYKRAMHAFAVLFPIWGVILPIMLTLFVLLILRLPANLHWIYAIGIILALLGSIGICAFFALVCDDDCLRITHEGIQFPLRFAAGLRGKLYRSWDELAVLKLRWAGSLDFTPNEFLGLIFSDGGAMTINLRHFDREELQQLLTAVKNCGKSCELDPEFMLLARKGFEATPLKERTASETLQPSAFGEFGMKYGARSTIVRWFSEYWTPLDKMLAPWLLVGILCALLVYGPQLLLNLTNFLPIEQLGNSGASIMAHNTLLAVASLALAAAVFKVLIPLLKPTHLIVSQDGIQKVWDRGLVWQGRMLPWSDVLSSYVLSRGRITDDCKLVFATAQNARAFCIHNAELADDDSRKLFSNTLSSLASKFNIAPDVFDVLIPQRTLTLGEMWDIAMDNEAAPESKTEAAPMQLDDAVSIPIGEAAPVQQPAEAISEKISEKDSD